jgi:hypothetical protein
MKYKRPQIVKTILNKKNNAGGITTPILQSHSTKTASSGTKIDI